MFKKLFVCEARTGEHLLKQVPCGVFSSTWATIPYGCILETVREETPKKCTSGYVEVRDGAWSADANAHKEKSTAIQMGTDDTKGYLGGSNIVLYEVST